MSHKSKKRDHEQNFHESINIKRKIMNKFLLRGFNLISKKTIKSIFEWLKYWGLLYQSHLYI